MEQHSIVIEPMNKHSVEAVVLLEQECFSAPWSKKLFLEELKNPLSVFITARLGENIAGYAGMHHIIDEGYIANIAVGKKFRQMGVASALLDNYLNYANMHALVSLTLEVRESNFPAQRLYEKYGFIKEGRRKDYYRSPVEDALILTLRF